MKSCTWVTVLKTGIITSIIGTLAIACGAADEPAPAPKPAPTAVPVATATSVPAVVATPTPAAVSAPIATAVPKNQPKYGGVATFAHRSDPRRGWDLSGSFTEQYPMQPIVGMGNLIRVCRDDPYKMCPGLATSWEATPDFKTWTFTVRDDLVWHDGEAFSAQTAAEAFGLIVFGYKERGPHRTGGNWGDIEKIEAPGNKVIVTLKSGVPGYLSLLSRSEQYFAYPPHLFKPAVDAGNPKATPLEFGVVGMGPFKLEETIKGSLISVRRFDKYWEKDDVGRQLPFMDGIDYVIMGRERDKIAAAIRGGRIDGGGRGAGTEMLPPQIAVLQKEFGDKIYFIGDPAGTNGMRMNSLSEGPWKDVRVRKAVSMVYDRQGFQDIFYPAFGPRPLFLPDSPFANPDFMNWPGYNKATKEKDLASAKKLLSDAGFPDGFDTKLMCRSPAWVPHCEYFAQQMAKLAIVAEIEPVDQNAHDDRGCSGDFETASAGGPNLVQQVPWAGANEFGTISTNECANVRHTNKRVDELFALMASTADVKEQIPLARELEKIIILDQAYYIITNNVKEYPYRSYIKGNLDPKNSRVNYLDFAWVWLDK
ncbi:ABC transporter substrate-binding protein [Dehalococcoidia bacterium]|nr:ABC transporter substrate-binding protein [Dehalococcoidia bacterium]